MNRVNVDSTDVDSALVNTIANQIQGGLTWDEICERCSQRFSQMSGVELGATLKRAEQKAGRDVCSGRSVS